ncbi:MAG: SapC family protein [Pseudomonadota bacterium]|jgi:hypothetical protein|nr:SapC family protein [Pseudomonadota bacterium]
MTNIVPLNKEKYRDLKVDGRPSAAHGDNQHFVQVIVGEFSHLLVHYPILFGKHRDTGQFFCGAMLGFVEGENQFLDDWRREPEFYRPLTLQRGPFYINGPELAIDLEDPRVGAESGQPLFTEQGQPSRYLQRIIWAFQDLQPGIEQTRIFIARLLELNLIEPIDIEVEFEDGTLRHCDGLYTINQDALARLADVVVVELFRRGYLALIHMMINSLKQVRVMARTKNARLLKQTEGLVAVPSAIGE